MTTGNCELCHVISCGVTAFFFSFFCTPAGRVQVTTPVDREEEERQDQRVYRAAEGFITRTSEALGEIMTPQ